MLNSSSWHMLEEAGLAQHNCNINVSNDMVDKLKVSDFEVSCECDISSIY